MGIGADPTSRNPSVCGKTVAPPSPYKTDPPQSSLRAPTVGASAGGFPTEAYCSATKSITRRCCSKLLPDTLSSPPQMGLRAETHSCQCARGWTRCRTDCAHEALEESATSNMGSGKSSRCLRSPATANAAVARRREVRRVELVVNQHGL